MSHAAIESAWKVTGISSTQKLVLLCLAEHAGADNRCWPSLALISDETCLSLRAAWQAARDLDACGLLKIEARGRNQSNVYTLTFDSQVVRPTIAPGSNIAVDAIAPDASMARGSSGGSTSCMSVLHVVPVEVAPRAKEPVIEPVIEPVKRTGATPFSFSQKAEPLKPLQALAALVQGIDAAQDPERDGWQNAWDALQCPRRTAGTTGIPQNVETAWCSVWRAHLAKFEPPPSADDMRKLGRWIKAGGAAETRKGWFTQLDKPHVMTDWFARSQAWDGTSAPNSKRDGPKPFWKADPTIGTDRGLPSEDDFKRWNG